MGVNLSGKVLKGRLRMLESGERVRVRVRVRACLYIATAHLLGPFATLQHPCWHLQVCWLTKEHCTLPPKLLLRCACAGWSDREWVLCVGHG